MSIRYGPNRKANSSTGEAVRNIAVLDWGPPTLAFVPPRELVEFRSGWLLDGPELPEFLLTKQEIENCNEYSDQNCNNNNNGGHRIDGGSHGNNGNSNGGRKSNYDPDHEDCFGGIDSTVSLGKTRSERNHHRKGMITGNIAGIGGSSDSSRKKQDTGVSASAKAQSHQKAAAEIILNGIRGAKSGISKKKDLFQDLKGDLRKELKELVGGSSGESPGDDHHEGGVVGKKVKDTTTRIGNNVNMSHNNGQNKSSLIKTCRYAFSHFRSLDECIKNLQNCFNFTYEESIGFFNSTTQTCRVRREHEAIIDRLRGWLTRVNIDAVCWLDYEKPNFCGGHREVQKQISNSPFHPRMIRINQEPAIFGGMMNGGGAFYYGSNGPNNSTGGSGLYGPQHGGFSPGNLFNTGMSGRSFANNSTFSANVFGIPGGVGRFGGSEFGSKFADKLFTGKIAGGINLVDGSAAHNSTTYGDQLLDEESDDEGSEFENDTSNPSKMKRLLCSPILRRIHGDQFVDYQTRKKRKEEEMLKLDSTVASTGAIIFSARKTMFGSAISNAVNDIDNGHAGHTVSYGSRRGTEIGYYHTNGNIARPGYAVGGISSRNRKNTIVDANYSGGAHHGQYGGHGGNSHGNYQLAHQYGGRKQSMVQDFGSIILPGEFLNSLSDLHLVRSSVNPVPFAQRRGSKMQRKDSTMFLQRKDSISSGGGILQRKDSMAGALLSRKGSTVVEGLMIQRKDSTVHGMLQRKDSNVLDLSHLMGREGDDSKEKSSLQRKDSIAQSLQRKGSFAALSRRGTALRLEDIMSNEDSPNQGQSTTIAPNTLAAKLLRRKDSTVIEDASLNSLSGNKQLLRKESSTYVLMDNVDMMVSPRAADTINNTLLNSGLLNQLQSNPGAAGTFVQVAGGASLFVPKDMRQSNARRHSTAVGGAHHHMGDDLNQIGGPLVRKQSMSGIMLNNHGAFNGNGQQHGARESFSGFGPSVQQGVRDSMIGNHPGSSGGHHHHGGHRGSHQSAHGNSTTNNAGIRVIQRKASEVNVDRGLNISVDQLSSMLNHSGVQSNSFTSNNAEGNGNTVVGNSTLARQSTTNITGFGIGSRLSTSGITPPPQRESVSSGGHSSGGFSRMGSIVLSGALLGSSSSFQKIGDDKRNSELLDAISKLVQTYNKEAGGVTLAINAGSSGNNTSSELLDNRNTTDTIILNRGMINRISENHEETGLFGELHDEDDDGVSPLVVSSVDDKKLTGKKKDKSSKDGKIYMLKNSGGKKKGSSNNSSNNNSTAKNTKTAHTGNVNSRAKTGKSNKGESGKSSKKIAQFSVSTELKYQDKTSKDTSEDTLKDISEDTSKDNQKRASKIATALQNANQISTNGNQILTAGNLSMLGEMNSGATLTIPGQLANALTNAFGSSGNSPGNGVSRGTSLSATLANPASPPGSKSPALSPSPSFTGLSGPIPGVTPILMGEKSFRRRQSTVTFGANEYHEGSLELPRMSGIRED